MSLTHRLLNVCILLGVQGASVVHELDYIRITAPHGFGAVFCNIINAYWSKKHKAACILILDTDTHVSIKESDMSAILESFAS